MQGNTGLCYTPNTRRARFSGHFAGVWLFMSDATYCVQLTSLPTPGQRHNAIHSHVVFTTQNRL